MIMEHLIGIISGWKMLAKLLKPKEAELLPIYGRRRKYYNCTKNSLYFLWI